MLAFAFQRHQSTTQLGHRHAEGTARSAPPACRNRIRRPATGLPGTSRHPSALRRAAAIHWPAAPPCVDIGGHPPNLVETGRRRRHHRTAGDFHRAMPMALASTAGTARMPAPSNSARGQAAGRNANSRCALNLRERTLAGIVGGLIRSSPCRFKCPIRRRAAAASRVHFARSAGCAVTPTPVAALRRAPWLDAVDQLLRPYLPPPPAMRGWPMSAQQTGFRRRCTGMARLGDCGLPARTDRRRPFHRARRRRCGCQDDHPTVATGLRRLPRALLRCRQPPARRAWPYHWRRPRSDRTEDADR